MFKIINFYKIFFFSCILTGYLSALIIPAAGNTAVSVQPQATFPTGDSTNEMRGFGAFTGGFILADNLTTCSYTSFFPISGSVEMRGGTLYIVRDLEFATTTTFVSVGTFFGATNNGQFSVFFPAQEGALSLPSGTSGINGSNNILNLIATLSQGSNPVNSVDWSSSNQFIAAGINQSGTANNLAVMSFNGSTLTAKVTASVPAQCTAVRWHPTLSYILEVNNTDTPVRAAYFYNTGANTLTQTGFINAATGSFGTAVSWSPDGTLIACGNIDLVAINSFNTGTGALASVDFLTTNPVQQNAIDWDPAGGNGFFAAGFAVSPQLRLYFFNGTNIVAEGTNAIGNTVSALAFAPSGGYLAIGLSGGTTNIRIFQRSGNTLTDLAASHIAETANVLGAAWSPDGNSVTFSLATAANETQLRAYSFNRTTNVLTQTGFASSSSNVNATRWSPNGLYIATGDSGNNVKVYGTTGTTTGPLTFNSTKAVFNSDIILTTSTLFKGVCVVDGNGHTFDISQSPSFKIDSGASVLLKNMVLKGISNSLINFTDSTGLLRLQDLTWIQNGNYSLTTGALEIDHSVLFTGTSVFVYSTAQTSTITSNAMLYFDAGMTFSYVPPTTSRNLLQMIDSSSELYLLNATLYSTTTGMQLTKGTLFIDGPCPVLSSATVQNQGIMFGDGTSSANNLTVKILPESGLNLNSGFLVYNNV